jgi:hypothetical protein
VPSISDVPQFVLAQSLFVDFSAVDTDSREAFAITAGDDREPAKLPGAVTFHAGRTSWGENVPVRPTIVMGPGPI